MRQSSPTQLPQLFESTGEPPVPFSQPSLLTDRTSLHYPSAVDPLLPMTSLLWFPSNYSNQTAPVTFLSPPGNHFTSYGLPTQRSHTEVFDALVSLEQRIGREGRVRFRRRPENGFDLTSDETYNEWKLLVNQVSQQRGRCPCKSACLCSCSGLGFFDCVCHGVCATGSHEPPTSPKTSSTENPQSLVSPWPYTISTPSADVFIDQWISGRIFLEAITLKKERKRKEMDEKEEKKKEKARLVAEKKRKIEEKKEKMGKEKEEKQKKKRE